MEVDNRIWIAALKIREVAESRMTIPECVNIAKEALAAADATAWRAISEAPNDMTRVDLWHEKFGRIPGAFWKLGKWCTNQGAKPRSGIDNVIEHQDRITHFMPLPKSPQEGIK